MDSPKIWGDSCLDFIFATVHSGLKCPRVMWDRNPISLQDKVELPMNKMKIYGVLIKSLLNSR